MTETLPTLAPRTDGPDWLRQSRSEAAERALAQGWPSLDDEDWRHSRIADLDLQAMVPADEAGPTDEALEQILAELLASIGDYSALVVTRDGYVVGLDRGDAGLEIIDLALPGAAAAALQGGRSGDLFGELNTAQAPSPVVVRSAAGAVIERPVVVAHLTGRDGFSTWPRLVIEAGQGSQVTVVELWLSADVASLSVPRTDVVAGRDAVVRHVVLSDLGPRMRQVATLNCDAGHGAAITSATVALGSVYSRFRIDAGLGEDNGEVRLLAAYFAEDDQVHDFRTVQDHRAKRTSSDLVFKGAVSGRARSVYSGVIRVNPGASGTSAFLTNRNLVLSAEARAYSVPNLEIVNENDLRSCGHAATSGPLDPDQIFYLESRGVPTEVARRLIVLGFFDDVVSKVPVPGLREVVRERVGRRLRSTEGIA